MKKIFNIFTLIFTLFFIVVQLFMLQLSLAQKNNDSNDDTIPLYKQELLKIRKNADFELDKIEIIAQEKIPILKKEQRKKIETSGDNKEQIGKIINEYETEFNTLKVNTFAGMNMLFHKYKQNLQNIISIENNKNNKDNKEIVNSAGREMELIKSRIKNISSYFSSEVKEQQRFIEKLGALAQIERKKKSDNEIKESIRKIYPKDPRQTSSR
ncbi:MAG: hypothetical protein HQK49_06765 [Oligoflexia bacterium]|nr:hypothetical protein [Oligoflexia bacterium]